MKCCITRFFGTYYVTAFSKRKGIEYVGSEKTLAQANVLAALVTECGNA